jgi:hypothetical protein
MYGINAVIQWAQSQVGMWFDGDDLNPLGQYAANLSQTHSPLKGMIWYRFIISSFLIY